MTGPVCPHCGDLARGCACPPEPYDGDLSANAIFPCWLSDIDRANFAEHERDHLRDQLAAERESLRIDLALAAQASERVARAARTMIAARWARETAPGDVDAAEALAQAEVHLKALLGPEDDRDSARNLLAETEVALCAEVRRLKAELHQEREANRPLRHEVEQARARVAALEQVVATLRDARRRADALASHGTVAMIEAYEAEDAAILALLTLLPENGA